MTTSISSERRSVSFAGCGFLGMYHIGAGMAIEEHVPGYIDRLEMFYGASAGAIVGVFAACGIHGVEGYKFVRELYDRAHSRPWMGPFGSLHPSFDLSGRVRVFLNKNLPLDAHRKCRGKVGISLTILSTLKNWIITDFNTRAELIQAVVCSCFIPLYDGVDIPKFRGKRCYDGGLSCNLPYSSDPTVITVSPFAGECDICPRGESEAYYQLCLMNQTVNVSWENIGRGLGALLFLPWKCMERVYEQGYNDSLSFLKKEGILPIAIPTVTTNGETTPPPYDDTTSDYYSMTTLCHSRHLSAVTDLDTGLASLENKEVQFDISYDEDEGINEGTICRSPQLNQLNSTELHVILTHWIMKASIRFHQKMYIINLSQCHPDVIYKLWLTLKNKCSTAGNLSISSLSLLVSF